MEGCFDSDDHQFHHIAKKNINYQIEVSIKILIDGVIVEYGIYWFQSIWSCSWTLTEM